jgi:hypothetical protein
MRIIDIITESKDNIINLGYPPIIAKLFFKQWGKQAYLIASWYKDYKNNRADNKDWFKLTHSSFTDRTNIRNLVDLYNATDNIEKYNELRRDIGLAIHVIDKTPINQYLQDEKINLMNIIEDKFFDQIFFTYYPFIQNIKSKKITDLNPYKNLSFDQANTKYEQQLVFEKTKPLKLYKNGYKWINVGPKCMFLGKLMSNCGSAGVMSSDPDKTIIALFDPNNKPHTMVTYSPNENRISGDEGQASTPVKSKYHPYVLDLAKILNAKFDWNRSKSKLLQLKYRLNQIPAKVSNIKKLFPTDDSSFDEYFTFTIDNNTYYSNGYSAISKSDTKLLAQKLLKNEITNIYPKVKQNAKSITLKHTLQILFNINNPDFIFEKEGIKKIDIGTLIKNFKELKNI